MQRPSQNHTMITKNILMIVMMIQVQVAAIFPAPFSGDSVGVVSRPEPEL